MQLGAIDYLTKPITSEQLAKIVVAFDARQQARVDDQRTYAAALINSDQGFSDRVRVSSAATGWTFRFFDGARDALKSLPGRLPDVVVVDHLADSSSGLWLIEQLQRAPGGGETRFYVASNSAISAGTTERAHALGAEFVDCSVLERRYSLMAFLELRS